MRTSWMLQRGLAGIVLSASCLGLSATRSTAAPPSPRSAVPLESTSLTPPGAASTINPEAASPAPPSTSLPEPSFNAGEAPILAPATTASPAASSNPAPSTTASPAASSSAANAPPRVAVQPPAALPRRNEAIPADRRRIHDVPGTYVMPPSLTTLTPEFVPIDLPTALRLAGVQNPDVLLARQLVVEAVAQRQLAAAQFLPSLNGGMNYDNHTGVLQQSNGNILSLNRASIYVGAGANAIAAGTIGVPGIVLSGNPADLVYNYLRSRQMVAARDFGNIAVRNQVFLRVTQAYCDLLLAEGMRAVNMQARRNARELARLTANYAKLGQGRPADANRAATELARLEADFQAAEGEIYASSGRLAALLNLDPSTRLHPTDAWIVPQELVPSPIPLGQLVALGLVQRPELGERRTLIREALLALDQQRLLPFSPTFLLGFSAGGMGGGSNLVSPVFGGFGGRTDLDAMAFWTLKNLGIGNLASINLARADAQARNYEWISVLDQVRAEIAQSYARMHARYAQISTLEYAVRSGIDGFASDLNLAEEGERGVRPIEVLNSLELLERSQKNYLMAIIDYNRSQFELYVALGQPPADTLARPVPTAGVVPRGEKMPGPDDPIIPPDINKPIRGPMGPVGAVTPPSARPVVSTSAVQTVSSSSLARSR